MSETKWTPGPWVFDERAWAVYGPKRDGEVCVVYDEGIQFKSDGYLIAAAPELYEALKNLRQSMVFMMEDPFRSLGTKCVDDADAALAKARGETS